jgi:O-antigen/teichoic acid export membrane protein
MTLFNFVVDFFRAINKIKYSSIIGLSHSILVCMFIAYSAFNNYGIKGCLLSYICSQIIISLIILILIFRVFFKGVKSKVDFFCMKPYLAYSLPLVPYSILIWITELSGRYFITYFLGLKKAGIYALSYNIVGKAFIIYAVIAYVIYPHISQLWSKGDSDQVKNLLEKGCKIFLYFAIPITLGLTYLSSAVIRLIAGKDFIVDPLLILFICIGSVFLGIYGIYSYIIDLSQKTYIVLYILIITATLNIVLNILLIPLMDIMGAAVSTLLTCAVQVTIIHFLSRKLINIRIDIDLFYILKCFFASLFMILVMFLFLTKVNIMNDISYVLISCFTGALIYFLSTGIIFRFKFNKFLKLIP